MKRSTTATTPQPRLPGIGRAAPPTPLDPGVFTQLAFSLAQAPEVAQVVGMPERAPVVGMDPAVPRVLYALPGEHVQAPYDRFHRPSPALVHSFAACASLDALVKRWSRPIEALNNPSARDAMKRLAQLVALPPSQGMPVKELQEVLNTLSALLDPASPISPPMPAAAMSASMPAEEPAPELPDLFAALRKADREARPELHEIARRLQNALVKPKAALDLGDVNVDDLDEFTLLVGMDAFVAARLALNPALTGLVLGAGLEGIPPWVFQIKTLQALQLHDFLGTLDFSRLPALQRVWLTGDAPELDLTYGPGRFVQVFNGDDELLNAADAPGHLLEPATPTAAHALTDPAAITLLARWIEQIPDGDVRGVKPLAQKVLDAGHPDQPPPNQPAPLTARQRLEAVVTRWRTDPRVQNQPKAAQAMQVLAGALRLGPGQGLSVAPLRAALRVLSAVLDPGSPFRQPSLTALLNAALMRAHESTQHRSLHDLANLLETALTNPKQKLDLDSVEAEDLLEFIQLGCMDLFVTWRLTRRPALTNITLSPLLQELPAFVRRFRTLQIVELPLYDSGEGNKTRLDLRGMNALQTVYFTIETPILERNSVTMPEGRTVELLDEDGEPLPDPVTEFDDEEDVGASDLAPERQDPGNP